MDRRNATASWSGYLHQGKVGLFLVLQKLHECLQTDEDHSNMKLEYESAEDIDLKIADKVISRHQIKAYKSAKYPNDYADVLSVQKYEYLDGKKKLVQKGFQINKYDEYANIICIEVEEDCRFLHIVSEVKGFNLNEKAFNLNYPQANYIPNPNNIQLFVYPDKKKHCELTNIETDKLKKFCIFEIRNILMLSSHPLKDDEDHHQNIYYELLNLLDNKIRQSHILKNYPVFDFTEVYEVVIDTSRKEKNAISLIRKGFVECWNEFINELELENEEIDASQIEVVEVFVKEINDLTDQKFIEFIRNLNPHYILSSEGILLTDVHKLCSRDAFKDIFYELLFNINTKSFHLDYVGYKENGGYLITLINRTPAKIGTVIKDLINNKQITEEIFNRKYLINGQINNILIRDKVDNIFEHPKAKWSREVTKADVFYLSNMSFINVETAIENLNSEG